MRLVHASDLHIGFKAYSRTTGDGFNLREEDVAQAFSRAIDKTIELKPDLVVVGGDVFHGPHPSNASIMHAYGEFKHLLEAVPDCELVIVAGNHDLPRVRDAKCILHLFEKLGGRVHVAVQKAERFSLRGGELSVFAVPDNVSPRPKFEPDTSARYNVLLLHGEIEGMIRKARPKTLEPTKEIAVEELAADGWSYIALGDYHVYHSVLPNAYYSGSIDYTSSDVWKDSREEIRTGIGGKGIIERDLDTGAHTFHALPLRRRVIDLPEIDATGLTAADLTLRIREVVESCPAGIDNQIVRLIVTEVEKYVVRDLDHRMLREFQVRAVQFKLDSRKPDAEAVARGVAPKAKARTMAERWVEFAGTRVLTAGIDRQALTDLGLFYLVQIEEKEATTQVTEAAA